MDHRGQKRPWIEQTKELVASQTKTHVQQNYSDEIMTIVTVVMTVERRINYVTPTELLTIQVRAYEPRLHDTVFS